jgi:hypothetical protein
MHVYKMIQSLRITILQFTFLSLLESYHLRRNYDTHVVTIIFPASFLICSSALLLGNDSVHEQDVLEPTLMNCVLRARLIRSTSA